MRIMKLGIIGLPQTGKTTIFNALTRQNQPTTMSGKIEVHTAVINVPDPRIIQLAQLYHPKKVTFAKVEYADVAGLEGRGQGDISGQLRNELGKWTGLSTWRAVLNREVSRIRLAAWARQETSSR